MNTSPEFPVRGHEIIELADSLLANGSLGGIPYGNVVVTTPQPRFTDGADPEMTIVPQAYTAFWPGGGPVEGKEFATIVTPEPGGSPTASELAQEITDIRSALASASISPETIARIPAGRRAAWERLNQPGIVPLVVAESQCMLFGVPLALFQTSRIVRSSILPEDSRIMHMWYPVTTLSPKPVLAKVRKVVREIIQSETI
jgi:hypothetical protein